MRTLLISEYEILAHDLDATNFSNRQIYMHYGPSAKMAGALGYHPNRMIYIIPETDPWFTVYSLKGIGQHHTFDTEVLERNGWI